MKTFFLCTSSLFIVALSGCSSFDWDGGRDGPTSSYNFFGGSVNTQTYHASHDSSGHMH